MQDAYAKYVKEFFFGTFSFNVKIYDQDYLKKTSTNEDSSTRLWWFQVCTEVANFQVAPSNDSIRSSKLDTKQVLLSSLFTSYTSLMTRFFALI